MLHAPAKLLEAEIVDIEGHPALLSPIERQVVLLSLYDPPGSVGDGSMLRCIFSQLFGVRAPNRLANPRLEALRVFCVRYRLDRSLIGRNARGVPLSPITMLAAAAVIDSRSPASLSREPLFTRMRRRFFPRS